MDCHIVVCLASTTGRIAQMSIDTLRHTGTRPEEWGLLYKSVFEPVLLPCGRVVRNIFP